ncbi:MAG: hypothetical protein IJ002_06925 [Clostridia bacterium]|nr:hypothetical protein [Clostridia bacterium]
MKNFIKKISAALLCVMLVSLMAVSVFAKDEYVDWEMSDDLSTLTGDGVVYTKYDAPVLVHEHASHIYQYEDEVSVGTPYLSDVMAPFEGSDIVWVEIDYTDVVIYTKGTGADELDRFFAGEGIYRLRTSSDSYRVSDLDETAALALLISSDSGEKVNFDVTKLKYKEHYNIALYDYSQTFYYVVGTLFKIDGKYWYADHSTLSNENFDADGNISFRSGEVALCAVDTNAVENLDKKVDGLRYVYTDYTWEDYDPYYQNDDRETSMTAFWVAYVILGFAVPLVIGGLAVAYANSKKFGKPKYFCSVAVTCGVWILCAAALLIIMLTI